MKATWRSNFLKSCGQAKSCNNSEETEDVRFLLGLSYQICIGVIFIGIADNVTVPSPQVVDRKPKKSNSIHFMISPTEKSNFDKLPEANGDVWASFEVQRISVQVAEI